MVRDALEELLFAFTFGVDFFCSALGAGADGILVADVFVIIGVSEASLLGPPALSSFTNSASMR